jgi:type I restriction enzyme S subunit
VNGSHDAELPEGWAVAQLAELASPSTAKVEPDQRPDTPYLSLEHIESQTNRIVGQGTGADVNSTKAVFQAGDVLYGKLRPYLNKVAIPQFEGICSTDILVFPPRPHVDSPFLMYFLSRREVVEFASHHSTGVQLPRIGFGTLGTVEVPLPPLAEQRRIVAAIERITGSVTAARERLGRVPSTLKRFRQAVLAAACSGRLTAAWRKANRDVEDARQLLARILRLRTERWRSHSPKRSYREPSTPSPDNDELPATWCHATFDQCAEDITVGHVGPMKERYAETGIPFLRSQNVRPFRFDPRGLMFVPADFHAALRKSRLGGGEVLVVRSGANTGDCCVFPSESGEANCADLVITRPLPGLEPAYAAIYINSPVGQAALDLRQTGMAQPHFNIGAMREKPFPLPPLAEQQEIISRVGALLDRANQIAAKVTAAGQRVDAMTQAVLAKAFRGELVPTEAELARRDGRDYEPASALLDRIRAERAAATPAANGQRRRRPTR